MQRITDILAAALPCPLYGERTKDRGECATYDLTVTGNDAIKRQVRLKVNLAADTMARGLELEAMADAALCTLGDRPLAAGITHCQRNGGGWVRDGDRHIRIAYYDIIMKNRQEENNVR